MRQAVNCDTGPPTLDVAPSLLVSLQHLLPTPLSDEEMKDLSPTTQHGTEHLQTSVSFLYHELQQTNTTLLSLHAVLQWSMEWSSHPSRVSSQAAQATREAAENKIPQLWRNVLPPHLSSLPSLLLVVQLLKESMDYPDWYSQEWVGPSSEAPPTVGVKSKGPDISSSALVF